jgi:aryl-alcohol dehydrogenase-like predicted oxidoreductase
MVTRREWLGMSLTAGAALALDPRRLAALATPQAQLITRAIPSTGERLPIVGLGSSATFAQVASSEDVSAVRGVLRTMVEHGGRVFDTAPSYGASEEVAGRIAREENLTDRIFWATKVNVAQGGQPADPAAARQQLQRSLERIGKRPVDLIQVHNLGDIPTQLGLLKDMKQDGQIRYIGVTTSNTQQYDALQRVMREEPLDFIGIDYAVDNRDVEQHILPLAQDRGIGVMVYLPFGRTRLWNRIGDRALPDWAQEFDAQSWAQFMIKYVASHPAVTVVTPGTSQPRNMADNMGAAMGRLPDEAMRRRMAEYVDALPSAQGVEPRHDVVLPVAVLDRYVGEYAMASGAILTFSRAGAGLAVTPPGGQQLIPMVTRSEIRFSVPGGGPIFEFQLDAEGTVTGLIMNQLGQRMQATRVQ